MMCVCVCFLKRFFYVCWLTADAFIAATATSSTLLYTRVYKKKKTKEQRKECELQ
jgi:hypothetical protein